MAQNYKELKDLWFKLRKERKYFEADKVKQQLRLWKKNQTITEK